MISPAIHSIHDLHEQYKQQVLNPAQFQFDLGSWLRSFRYGDANVRPLVPGELCFVMADTGVGKTAILQNIAKAARAHEVLLFELELPGTLTYERFAAMANRMSGPDIEASVQEGRTLSHGSIDHIYTCSHSGLTLDQLEETIAGASAAMQVNPNIVIVDYIGLVQSNGKSRYERVSDTAEALKIIAKRQNCIIIAATQIHRRAGDDADAGASELYLHDARDSGAIEYSCGLLLGAWREPTNPAEQMWIKVLKNTKGRSGKKILCDFIGAEMRIEEHIDLHTAPA